MSEFFSADLPHCREILYLHHRLLKCSKKHSQGDVGMAGLYKTILKLPVDTARSLWHWWSFQLSSLWLGHPPTLRVFLSLLGYFQKTLLHEQCPWAPLKVVHPGLDQSPLEAHPTTAVSYFQPSHEICLCNTRRWARNRLNKLMIKYSTSLVFITIRKHQLHFLFYECTQGNPLQ